MSAMLFDPDEPPGRITLRRNHHFPDDMTIGEARAKLAHMMELGIDTNCGCCGCPALVAKRSIHTHQAVGLILIARNGGVNKYVDTAAITHANARMDVAKSKWWGLLAEEGGKRKDGGPNGVWKLTPAGAAFVFNRMTVTKYAHVFDNRVQWRSGPQVTIVDCLHNRFDWRELMYG
jgi:hypothetical protein